MAPSVPSDFSPRPEDGDGQFDEEGARDERREDPLARDRVPERLLESADVGGDEDVEDHDRAGVDDDLRGRHELGVEQQEQPREREQVNDQGEHL